MRILIISIIALVLAQLGTFRYSYITNLKNKEEIIKVEQRVTGIEDFLTRAIEATKKQQEGLEK